MPGQCCMTTHELCSAETQGKTDQYISTWLKQQKREDIVLATKVRRQQALTVSPSQALSCRLSASATLSCITGATKHRPFNSQHCAHDLGE